MRVSVGIDVAKEVHRAAAVDERGEVLLDRPLPNAPDAVWSSVADLRSLAARGGPRSPSAST